jgi:hypothetical protein
MRLAPNGKWALGFDSRFTAPLEPSEQRADQGGSVDTPRGVRIAGASDTTATAVKKLA